MMASDAESSPHRCRSSLSTRHPRRSTSSRLVALYGAEGALPRRGPAPPGRVGQETRYQGVSETGVRVRWHDSRDSVHGPRR